jgi:hypothetical protein
MTSVFGDNTTVVGLGEAHVSFDGNVHDRSSGKSKEKPSLILSTANIDDFISVDYALEERPFFVPIGKDGIVAALQKLDRQLKNVRFTLPCSYHF